ncbi:hypothetical protein VPH35_066282 [Triticum aestivum]
MTGRGGTTTVKVVYTQPGRTTPCNGHGKMLQQRTRRRRCAKQSRKNVLWSSSKPVGDSLTWMLRKMVNGQLQPYAKGTISNPKCKDHVRKRLEVNEDDSSITKNSW